ncbi:MAG: hypothetical protein ABEJ72_03165 [Candidatus Aenigmatarchaeota archaeon]
MVDITKGEDQRQVEAEDVEAMTSSQLRTGVREVLDEMDQEMTDVRYAGDRSIHEERSDTLDAYTDRIMDLIEE